MRKLDLFFFKKIAKALFCHLRRRNISIHEIYNWDKVTCNTNFLPEGSVFFYKKNFACPIRRVLMRTVERCKVAEIYSEYLSSLIFYNFNYLFYIKNYVDICDVLYYYMYFKFVCSFLYL
jgi:hypothetical protein